MPFRRVLFEEQLLPETPLPQLGCAFCVLWSEYSSNKQTPCFCYFVFVHICSQRTRNKESQFWSSYLATCFRLGSPLAGLVKKGNKRNTHTREVHFLFETYPFGCFFSGHPSWRRFSCFPCKTGEKKENERGAPTKRRQTRLERFALRRGQLGAALRRAHLFSARSEPGRRSCPGQGNGLPNGLRGSKWKATFQPWLLEGKLADAIGREVVASRG